MPSENASFNVSSYYQYQKETALLHIASGNMAPGSTIQLSGPAETLLAPKGHIGVVQVVVNVKTGTTHDSQAWIPIGFTWSNRTELLKGSEVRGHIGIQFDASKLFAK